MVTPPPPFPSNSMIYVGGGGHVVSRNVAIIPQNCSNDKFYFQRGQVRTAQWQASRFQSGRSSVRNLCGLPNWQWIRVYFYQRAFDVTTVLLLFVKNVAFLLLQILHLQQKIYQVKNYFSKQIGQNSPVVRPLAFNAKGRAFETCGGLQGSVGSMLSVQAYYCLC